VASAKGVEELHAKFLKLEVKVAGDLDAAKLVDVEPEPPRAVLPAIGPTPTRMQPGSNVGLPDFEPRGLMRNPAPVDDGPQVTPLGDGAGYRIGGTR
jgi:hypothetical protein